MASFHELLVARFLPPGVVQRLVQGDDLHLPEKRVADVAVLFVDVQRCSVLCERLLPEDMNHLLEVAFGRFFDVVHEAGGDVNEIMGDGFMAVFEGRLLAESVRAAADAALTIRQVAGAYSSWAVSLPEVPFVVNIGLHGGSAFVGVTRFPGRTGERWTYTASGPVTNLAARLSALAHDGAILVSGAAAASLTTEYALIPIGKHALKNIAHAVEVYRLEGRGRQSVPAQDTQER